MNSPENKSSSQTSYASTDIESLLLSLDAEADSLSPEIMNRLVRARHQAAMRSGRQTSSGSAAVLHRQQLVQVQARSPEAGVCRLQHYFDALWQVRPLSASLATCCIASLAAILVVNTAQILSVDGTGNMAMTSTPTGLAMNTVSVENPAPLFKAVSSEASPGEAMPEMTPEESLDLVGSVDFLLWLDSQQG